MHTGRTRVVRSMAIIVLAMLSTTTLSEVPVAGQESPDESAVPVDGRTSDDIRALYGAPDAFTVLYFDEPAEDGTVVPATMATWSYFDEGLEFTLAGDEVIAEDPIELEGEAIAEPVPYDPEQFHAYMSLEEVLAAAGLEDYLGGPVDDLVEGGELFFADRLTWGMTDGELRYLEAVALEAEAIPTEAE